MKAFLLCILSVPLAAQVTNKSNPTTGVVPDRVYFSISVQSSVLPWLCVICLGTMLTLSAPSASAQSTSTGTVSGQVKDQHNAVVIGAEVVLVDTSTNASHTTVTNDVGRYIFLNVAPGNPPVCKHRCMQPRSHKFSVRTGMCGQQER
jgi:Carboxypeptidase regulatory-like domain